MVRDFALLMAQVGATSFALMFAAVQVRWRDWASTRLGKLAATTALMELLTVTVVSVSYYARVCVWQVEVWQAVAIACWALGYVLTFLHMSELRRRRRVGYMPTPADRFQSGWAFAPFISYGVLLLATAASFIRIDSWTRLKAGVGPDWIGGIAVPFAERLGLRDDWESWLAGVLVWFLISGLVEVFVTLSPNMLEPEPSHFAGTARIPTTRSPHETPNVAARFLPDEDDHDKVAVVLLPDIWGATTDALQLADRLAQHGHQVLVPDYYRGKRSIWPVLRVLRRIGEHVDRFAGLAVDCRAWLTTHGGDEDVAVVGMSIGGTAATANLDGWSAAALLYPELPHGFRRPHHVPPTTIFVGGNDSERVQKDAVSLASALHPSVTVVRYADARHGFMGSGRSIPVYLRPFLRRRVASNPLAAEAASRRSCGSWRMPGARGTVYNSNRQWFEPPKGGAQVCGGG